MSHGFSTKKWGNFAVKVRLIFKLAEKTRMSAGIALLFFVKFQQNVLRYEFLPKGDTKGKYKGGADVQGKVELCGVNTARLKVLSQEEMDN